MAGGVSVNDDGEAPPSSPLENGLDVNLARALRAPRVPSDLRHRLMASINAAETESVRVAAARLEHEYRIERASLDAVYKRQRFIVVAILVGGALGASMAMRLLLPLLEASFGPWAPLVVYCVAVAGGLVMAWYYPSPLMRRMR
jgi:hypothetical protein